MLFAQLTSYFLLYAFGGYERLLESTAMSEHDLDDVLGVGAGRDAPHRVGAGDHYPAHQHPAGDRR